MTRARALLKAMVGMLVLSAAPGAASTVPMETTWMSGGAGATFASVLTLTRGQVDTDLVVAGTPAPAFVVGFHYRTPRVDIGVMAGSVGSGSLSSEGQPRSTGHKLRLAPWVRWRYIDDSWGSLFFRLTPSVTVIDHSDAMRAEVVSLGGDPRDFFPTVETNSIGFSFGASFGVLINVTSWLLLYLDMEVVTTVTNIEAGTGTIGYTAVQPVFATGFEARL